MHLHKSHQLNTNRYSFHVVDLFRVTQALWHCQLIKSLLYYVVRDLCVQSWADYYQTCFVLQVFVVHQTFDRRPLARACFSLNLATVSLDL